MFSFFELLFLNLKVKVKNCWEYFKVIYYYYSNGSFFLADTYLLVLYLFQSPFKISRDFLASQGESDLYTFGETPLTTLDTITKRVGLQQSDLVFELGCGRGRTCFWIHAFIGCRVVGVDNVPAFIHKANAVKERYSIPGVEFRLEDILKTDLAGATVIYLYGICYSSEFIRTLIYRLEALPKGAKVITVSYALEEFLKPIPFKIVDIFPADFTWGSGDIYLQVKEE